MGLATALHDPGVFKYLAHVFPRSAGVEPARSFAGVCLFSFLNASRLVLAERAWLCGSAVLLVTGHVGMAENLLRRRHPMVGMVCRSIGVRNVDESDDGLHPRFTFRDPGALIDAALV